jgi:hypothetical protein
MSSCPAPSASVPRLIWLRICRSVTSGSKSGWLCEGVSFTHMAVLVAIALVATTLAPWFFSRRDVAT